MQNCLFVFGALFAVSNWQFISLCSLVISGQFMRNLSIRGYVVMRQTQCCWVADSNPTRSRVLINSRLISFFLISLDRAAFWSCSRKCL